MYLGFVPLFLSSDLLLFEGLISYGWTNAIAQIGTFWRLWCWTCLNNCHFSTTIKNTFHITTLFLSGRIMKRSKIDRNDPPFPHSHHALGMFSSPATSGVSELLSQDGHTRRTPPAAPCPPSVYPVLTEGSADTPIPKPISLLCGVF